ncbi:hypothetical protein C8J57DRAFT_1527365 [Mycena rebaudengoi]|nr:hypothetical protein C8J57DRAFT_1527365 [Mycena rebaudengoi]
MPESAMEHYQATSVNGFPDDVSRRKMSGAAAAQPWRSRARKDAGMTVDSAERAVRTAQSSQMKRHSPAISAQQPAILLCHPVAAIATSTAAATDPPQEIAEPNRSKSSNPRSSRQYPLYLQRKTNPRSCDAHSACCARRSSSPLAISLLISARSASHCAFSASTALSPPIPRRNFHQVAHPVLRHPFPALPHSGFTCVFCDAPLPLPLRLTHPPAAFAFFAVARGENSVFYWVRHVVPTSSTLARPPYTVGPPPSSTQGNLFADNQQLPHNALDGCLFRRLDVGAHLYHLAVLDFD